MSQLPVTISVYQGNNVATQAHQRTIRFSEPIDLTGTEICLNRISIPVSWPNVTSQNNSFAYVWSDGQTYPVVIASGEYTISALAAAFTSQMMADGHYLINPSTGATMFFLLITFAQNLYRTVLTALPVPTTMPSGYTYGTSTNGTASWTLPSTSTTPQFIIPAIPVSPYGNLQPYGLPPPTVSFSSLIGVTSGTYPATPSSVPYAYVATQAPSNPVSLIAVTCDRVFSAFNSNSNLLYAFTATAGFGVVQDEQPQFGQWAQAGGGWATTLTFSLLDQLGAPLLLNDPAVHLRFTIRKRA